MTLTTRLSFFFTTMLAVVLVGFSVALYALADQYLHRQAQERLDALLSTLGAAVDVGPEGVEWEPNARPLNLEAPAYSEPVAWIIGDNQGRVLDRSKSTGSDQFVGEFEPRLVPSNAAIMDERGQWHVGQRWIRSGGALEVSSEYTSFAADPSEDGVKFPMLSITAGVSLEPIRTTLRRLAMTLLGLSATVWTITLIAGRFVCQSALMPVRKMAVAAREMEVNDLTQRLPVITSGDELEDLNNSFNRLLDRVQEAFERQLRFTGDASHQLRTPLTIILGQIDVTLRKDRSPEEYQRVLSTVQRNSRHLSRIVESLLFLARADADALQPSLEQLDLVRWLPTYLDTWKDHDRSKDITLDMDGSEDRTISVPPELFCELLDILVDNACKYSPPGTPIQIRWESTEHDVWIHILDHGYGIAEHELPNLFLPFRRSEDSRRRGIEGVGLGLSIAKRLTAIFNGELTVESQHNTQTRFTVRLPRSVTRGGTKE